MEGIALILFGILTLGIASAVGSLFLSSGLVALLVYSWSRATSSSRSLLFSAVLSIAAGIPLLLRPMSGVISLTVTLIVFFALGGTAKLYYPLDRSHELSRYGGGDGPLDLRQQAYQQSV